MANPLDCLITITVLTSYRTCIQYLDNNLRLTGASPNFYLPRFFGKEKESTVV